jgi:hypothetical protein
MPVPPSTGMIAGRADFGKRPQEKETPPSGGDHLKW